MESSWRRAWKDTERFRQSAKSFWGLEVVGAAMFGVVGAFGGFLLTPKDISRFWQFAYPSIGGAVGIILGFVIIFGLIFALNLFRAPYMQRNEARKKVQELLNENIPHISVKPATGKKQSDWERTEHLMWAELQVSNISAKELKEVQVNIAECLTIQEKQESPNHDDFVMWDFLNLKPFCVYWSERQTQSKQMSLVIPSGATRSALIAFQDNSNGDSFYFNTLNYNHVVRGGKIGVEISSCEALLWRGNFYIECHPNYYQGERAKFEFVEWDSWVKNRNVTPLNPDRGD